MATKKVKAPYEVITSYEDACKILKRKPVKLGTTGVVERYKNWIQDVLELTTIIEAINVLIPEPAGEFPDWSNKAQWKYYLWAWIKANKRNPGGVGFSRTHCDDTDTGSAVGSRFCLKSQEAVEYVLKTFPDLCKRFLLIMNKKK